MQSFFARLVIHNNKHKGPSYHDGFGRMDLQQSMQSVPIATNVVNSNPAHGKVYLIQRYVIKLVNDLRQVSGFLCVPRFPPPIKLIAMI